MRRHLRQNAQSDSDDDHVVAPVLQSVGNLLLDGFLILSEQYLDVVASIIQAIARAVHAGDNLLRAYTRWKIRTRKIDVPRIRSDDHHRELLNRPHMRQMYSPRPRLPLPARSSAPASSNTPALRAP